MRQAIFSYVEGQLQSTEILPRAVILHELLKNGSISQSTFYGQVDANTGDKFLKKKHIRIPLQFSRDHLSLVATLST
jgi:hypothetical protein